MRTSATKEYTASIRATSIAQPTAGPAILARITGAPVWLCSQVRSSLLAEGQIVDVTGQRAGTAAPGDIPDAIDKEGILQARCAELQEHCVELSLEVARLKRLLTA